MIIVAFVAVVALGFVIALAALSGYLVVRSVGGASQQPRATAIVASSVEISPAAPAVHPAANDAGDTLAHDAPEGVASAAQPVAADAGEAEEVNARWVEAVLARDQLGAEAVYAATSAEELVLQVSNYIDLTAITLNLTEIKGDYGRFLRRYEVVDSQLGTDAAHRLLLTRLLFEQGSLCFATAMTRASGSWLVETWNPADEGTCDEAAAMAPTNAVQRAHESWVGAVLAGDSEFATSLYTPPDGVDAKRMVSTYVELTRYVISVVQGEPHDYGPYRDYELLGTYEVSATDQVGLTQVFFEQGSLCFQADLSAIDGSWLVTKWNQVEVSECEALSGQG